MTRKTPEAKLQQLRARYAADPEKYRQRARDQRARTGKTYRNPAKERTSRLLKRYALAAEQFNTRLREQGWACKICRRSFIALGMKPCVDHDHATGVVRGILCVNCNNGLGAFKDSITNLTSAISYLLEPR